MSLLLFFNKYAARAVNFDGTNDYALSGGGLTGAADVVSGTMSVWFRLAAAGFGTTRSVINSQASRIRLNFSTGGIGDIRFRDATGVDTIRGSMPAITDTNWHHVILTTNGTAGQCYLDDQPVTLVVAPTNVAIDWTLVNFSIGASITGTELFSGDVADIWISPVYVGDLSVTANRRKFFRANGTPEDLGSTGQIPTGTAALWYHSGATASWHTNKGTGAGFTLTGALTDGQLPIQVSLVTTRTITASLEAIALRQGLLATTSLDSAGQARFTATALLEAAAQARRNATATLEAAAQKALAATAALEAAAQKPVTAATALEAAAQVRRSAIATLEAVARKALTATATLEALGAPLTSLAAIPPDVILASTNLSGAVANIRDDPESPDASWLIAPGPTAATDLRVSFPTPPGT